MLAAVTIPCAGLAAGMPDAAIAGNAPGAPVLNASRQVSDAELSGLRGGYFTAAGAKFDFGASVQTLVNGELALQTNLQWTAAGPVTQMLKGQAAAIQTQVASNLAQAGIQAGIAMPDPAHAANNPATAGIPAPETAAQASAAAPNSGAASTADTAELASVNVTGDAVPGLVTSVQIPGATGGSTQVLANIGSDQIQNIVLNSASGQEITQNTNLTLTIHNFPDWQQQVAQNALSARLVSDMLAASGISAGH